MNDTRISNTGPKMHPVFIIAATAVILTCLLAIGVMTGIVPSPLTKSTAPTEDLTKAPTKKTAPVASGLTRENLRENRTASRSPAPDTRSRTAERPPVGRTEDSAPSRTIAGGGPAPVVAAACTNCGSVSSVRAVREQGEAGIIGPAAGGLLGGVVGSQIGGGTGKTIATIAGAAGGAMVGTEVERRSKSTTSYVVAVRMNDGASRSFTYPNAPGVEAGDKVRVVDGRLLRD